MHALLVGAVLGAVAGAGAVGIAYVWLSRLVDARLQAGLVRAEPRVFARPFELRRGQALSAAELVDRLNDLGYAQRPHAEQPGEFAVGDAEVAIRVKDGSLEGRLVRALFPGPRRASARHPPSSQIEALEVAGRGRTDRVTFDPPLLAAMPPGGRERRRRVPLSRIPRVVRDAVLAIEDRRFYEHPGVDLLRTAAALLTNLRGDRPYLVGGSTLTQQLVKNVFLTPEKTLTRKLLEQMMAIILERRLTKDQILELYLNEVYLGQRGSFAIHGVAEAARLYFGKDVTNLTLSEAATLAGMIQAPPVYSPVRSPARARDRRNVVLRAMVEAGWLAPEAARQAEAEPLAAAPGGLEAEAPYFVDLVGQTLAGQFPALASHPVDVHTTLDLHLQRIAQDAVREGLAAVDARLARRRVARRAQAALVAVDARTGDVLAFVGGRTYSTSQFNRVVHARRQPGSVFKPFVYLAAFEAAVEEGRTDVTPATLLADEPATFLVGAAEWTPGNYEDEYEGVITARRALTMSRNLATIRMAERVGFEKVAAFWRQFGTSMPPQPYPSIALGVFEATPWEIAEAFTIFTNGGETRPLRTIVRLEQDGRPLPLPPPPPPRRVARPDTTFLVTYMLQGVLDEGTGAGARAAGFTLPAAGKTGTTNDLRDAWFVGFTPELLTVVWVGHDDNRALGLSGAQAALPIWTAFMRRALAGRAPVPFDPPDGVAFVDIDRDTGDLAGPGCPRIITEAFLAGTEPAALCALHNPAVPEPERNP